MTDQPLSQEMIDALLQQAAGGSPAAEAAAGDAAEEPQALPQSAPPVKRADATPNPAAPSVRPVAFAPLPAAASSASGSSIDLLLDVPLQVTVELGRTSLSVRKVLGLGAGSVVELNRLAGEPVDLLVNNRLIARGEVVVIDESFGVRVTEIVGRSEGERPEQAR